MPKRNDGRDVRACALAVRVAVARATATTGAADLGAALSAGLAALVLSLAPLSAAFASGLDRLNAFMTGTHSARADFTQRIVDHNGKQVQQSGGTLEFARPGKFRWVYAKPYSQTIVGDGEKVWIFDPDLNQVTVRKLDVALGSTPAALLAGNNDALKSFTLADDGDKDGVQWVLANPHDKNSQFTHIRLGFAASGIQAMELEDSLGQKTTLQFSNFAANPQLDPGTFHFSPPKGVDVVGR